jgi:hypothetical protein
LNKCYSLKLQLNLNRKMSRVKHEFFHANYIGCITCHIQIIIGKGDLFTASYLTAFFSRVQTSLSYLKSG